MDIQGHGNEILYNGQTGEQLKTSIFIGPTYYQKLKHLTSCDKVHSRSGGTSCFNDRQPAEGRSSLGGFEIWRNGKRLYDCTRCFFISQRKTYGCVDKYTVFICEKCKIMATANPETKLYECKKMQQFQRIFTNIYTILFVNCYCKNFQCMSIMPRSYYK